MTTSAEPPVFVDTNTLVFADVAHSPFHHAAVTTLTSLDQRDVELWISRQILREYLATLTRPGTLTSPLPIQSLTADVRRYAAHFHIAEDGAAVTDRLLTLLEEIPAAGRQVHDANIVATMLVHGIPRLLTHNTADFARYASLITVESL